MKTQDVYKSREQRTAEYEMKMHEAKQIVSQLSMMLSVKDGEFRITFARNVKGFETYEAREAVAYYTDDLRDAVGTARMMYAHHSQFVTHAKSQDLAMHNNELAKH